MHVGEQNTRWSYNMEGNSLPVDETEKDLGIWISSNRTNAYMHLIMLV